MYENTDTLQVFIEADEELIRDTLGQRIIRALVRALSPLF